MNYVSSATCYLPLGSAGGLGVVIIPRCEYLRPSQSAINISDKIRYTLSFILICLFDIFGVSCRRNSCIG